MFMGPLIISILFWLIGFVVILGGRLMNHFLVRLKKKMDAEAEKLKFKNNKESIKHTIGEDVIDMIPWYYVRLIFTIVGMVIIALGFVSLGFWSV